MTLNQSLIATSSSFKVRRPVIGFLQRTFTQVPIAIKRFTVLLWLNNPSSVFNIQKTFHSFSMARRKSTVHLYSEDRSPVAKVSYSQKSYYSTSIARRPYTGFLKPYNLSKIFCSRKICLRSSIAMSLFAALLKPKPVFYSHKIFQRSSVARRPAWGLP